MTQSAQTASVPEWTLNDRLRKAREVANVSAEDMASVLEVSDRTIRNYESGKTPIKRPSLMAWAMRCGVPFGWLVAGDEPTDSTPTSTKWYMDIRGLPPGKGQMALFQLVA